MLAAKERSRAFRLGNEDDGAAAGAGGDDAIMSQLRMKVEDRCKRWARSKVSCLFSGQSGSQRV